MNDLHEDPVCPDCRISMEPGYLPDRAYTRTELTSWVRGRPFRTRWGLKGFFWKMPASIPVITFRCPQCGLLESYAK